MANVDDEELRALIEKIDALASEGKEELSYTEIEEKELILNPILRCRNEQD